MTFTTPDIPLEVVSHDDLFARLETGHVLVTANNRLARALAGQYGLWRMRRGEKLWQSPAILSWEAWLDRLWEAAGLQGIEGTIRAVPGGQQLISLWESVLRSDAQAGQLLRPESMASRLRETRRLVVEWNIDIAHSAWFGDGNDSSNENHAAFHRWNSSFEDLCRCGGWIAPEDRGQRLGQAILKSKFHWGETVGLLGFDEFSPAQAELIGALSGSGTQIDRLAISLTAPNAVLCKIRGKKEELQKMAQWARHWAETEPDSRIAIVVPDLQSRRGEVEQVLREILTPGSDPHGPLDRPWNTSLGIPLDRHPMIRAAFDLLRLLERRVDIQAAGRVLRSPWISGAAAERNARALLEKRLRENYPRQLSLSEIRYRAREMRWYGQDRQQLPEEQRTPRPWNSPLMAATLKTLMGFKRESKGSRRPSAWAESIDQLLGGLGWPMKDGSEGETFDHGTAWQAFQSWQNALRELASLDAAVRALNRGAAISQLRHICREHIFQPRTAQANIQVLGLYEASGLSFEHMWVLGLHHGNWPPAARPDPFIPAILQREAGIPHSSPQRELEVARNITHRLMQTAENTVFSYPEKADGEPVLPSPLLRKLPVVEVEDLPQWKGLSWLQAVNAAASPAVEPLEPPGRLVGSTARGGSSILKHQALCPFRAFANNRLAAGSLESPVDGISAMLHGSLLHRVLERFWKEIQTRDALLQLDDVPLGESVHGHIDKILQDERSLGTRPGFRKVEASRLFRLVMNCLEQEKLRAPFEVVGFEKEVQYWIEGQAIRLFVDRLDRLESGEMVIIDYKTGKVDPKKWFGNRPEDPQLPLYAISAEVPPVAVVFAVIRDDECLYKGVVRREGIFPGLPPGQNRSNAYLVDAGTQMTSTISEWQRILHGLMADFLAGEAAIDPKEGRIKTCDKSYCELQSLCRIGELEQMPLSAGHVIRVEESA